MERDNLKQYFDYLKGRSQISQYYRRLYLYPKLSEYLSGKVLDIGCGIGDFLAYYKNSVGIDINPHVVEYCQNLGYNAFFVKDDIFPFNNAVFNGAILDNVIEHLNDPKPLLIEANRVLAKDGIFIVGVPGTHGYTTDSTHKLFYDEKKMRLTLSEFGFRLFKVIYTPIRSEWLNRHMRQYCLYGFFIKIKNIID